jgi:CubicO group peptidase (beta-lactamase class C family)
VDYRTYGQRDIASGAPMTKDTIFRDYSMTKPVTGVAMMILYEQGKWLPSDPISKFIPEFAHLKVFKGRRCRRQMILVDPDHAPTMRELMTHTAGFSYGFGKTPVDAMYRDLKVMQSKNLQEMIDKLAKIPLLYQPGKAGSTACRWTFEGYIVEKLSGQSLPDFMRDHIYTPLGMRDAGFYVPPRQAQPLRHQLHADPARRTRRPAPCPATTRLQSAAHHGLRRRRHGLHRGGLLPLRADAGQRRRARRQAHPRPIHRQAHDLEPRPRAIAHRRVRHRHFQVMRPGFGWGYNCAVIFDPPEANLSDGKGTFFWDGAAGTWFWVDPTNDIVFVA